MTIVVNTDTVDGVIWGATESGERVRRWLAAQLGEPVCGLRLLSWAGQNMVAFVATASGREAVARMSPTLPAEARARTLERCRAQGVPVPNVISAGECDGDGALILEYIPGVSLARVSSPAAATMMDVGRALGRLHSVPVEGAGPLDEAGRGRAPSWWAAVMAVRHQSVQTPDARAHEILARALECLEELRDVDLPAGLLHGDWAPRHVIIDPRGRVWLIDLDDALAGDCVWDFACWEYQSALGGHGISDMLSGYRQVREPGSAIALRMRLHRLAVHVSVLIDAWNRSVASADCELVVERVLDDVVALSGREE